MNRFAALLFIAFLPFSGCLDDGAPAASPEPAPEPQADGRDEADGMDGQEGSGAASAPGPGLRRVEVARGSFQFHAVQGSGAIPIEVPAGSVAVYLWLDYQNGVYDRATFTLGECQAVSPQHGTGATVAGSASAGTGATSRNVLYACGDVPDGPAEVGWSIEAGTVQGTLVVSADVPA